MIKNFFMGAAVIALLSGMTPVNADPIVIKVDGKQYTYSQVMTEKATLPKKLQSAPDDKLFPLLQNKIVDSYLVGKAAATSGVENKQEVKDAIEKVKKQIIEQAFLFDKIKNLITEDKIKVKFDELIKNFPKEEETHARHILVKDKATATAVIKALKQGVDFKKIAKEKSIDTATAKEGGDLGFFRKSELTKDLAEIAFTLTPGTYTQEPVKTEFGWHVLFVEARREAKPPTFEEAKDTLKAMMAEELLVNMLKDLRKGADVQLFDKDGKPVKEEKTEAADKAPPKENKGK